MDSGLSVLLGALVGAAAAVSAQLITATSARKAELRRSAVQAGFDEWKALRDHAVQQRMRARVYPPALFIHFNYELLKLLESSDGLTPERYADLVRKSEDVKAAIEAAHSARHVGDEL